MRAKLIQASERVFGVEHARVFAPAPPQRQSQSKARDDLTTNKQRANKVAATVRKNFPLQFITTCLAMPADTSLLVMATTLDRWRTTWAIAICNRQRGARRWQKEGLHNSGKTDVKAGSPTVPLR